MATEKISATLDRDVVAQIRKAVGPRQLSAFLTAAAKEKLQRSRILAYLDELDATKGDGGPRARRLASRRIARVIEP